MTAETRVERRIVVGHRMIGVVEDDGTEPRLIANFWQPQTTVAKARENARKFLAVDDLLDAVDDLLASVNGLMDVPGINEIATRNKADWALLCERFDRAHDVLRKARGKS